MKQLLTGITTIFTILLLNTFGLASHASAMPMAGHEMKGMNHSSNKSSANCATLCRTAVTTKEDNTIAPAESEEDDESDLPYYAEFYTGIYDELDMASKALADNVKPPPKIPIYILYAVFRV